MDWKNLFYLPDWDENKIRQYEQEGEAWKNEQNIAAARALYLQWQETFYMAVAVAETLAAEEAGDVNSIQKFMYENLLVVAPKILSAASTTAYVLKMENAAIIRHNCKEFLYQLHFTWLTAMADKQHIITLRESMEIFKQRFQDWVATFEKDDMTDEWGLFI